MTSTRPTDLWGHYRLDTMLLGAASYTADPVLGFHAEGDHVPQPQYR